MAVLIILLALSMTAAFWDLRYGRIPNALTYPALLAGLIWHAFQGSLAMSLFGMAAAGGVFLIVWLLKQVGGGDVKLMAALGTLAGWPQALDILVFTALAGGALGVFILLFGKRFGFTVADNWRESRMPYGMAIAVGVVISCVVSLR